MPSMKHIDVLVARAESATTHARALKKLVRGRFRAIEFLANQPQDAAKRMAPRLNGEVE